VDHDSGGHWLAARAADLQCYVHPTIYRKREWTVTISSNASNPTLTIAVVRHGSCAGGARNRKSCEFSFGSVTVGSQSVACRDGHQLQGRFDCNDFSSRHQWTWIQSEWDHCSGHAGRPGKAQRSSATFTPPSAPKCERQRHLTSNAIQFDADDTTLRNGHGSSRAACVSRPPCLSAARVGRDQRNGIGKPDASRRECYGHGCELEQLSIQLSRPHYR